MTKALFKKQLLEVFSWLYKNRKTGKIRSGKGIFVYVLLYIFLFGFLGSIFYGSAVMLCEPLAQVGLGWLYWCLMGLITIFLGVFGSVFTTYTTVYQAKDNDFLLSMPIPASKIIFVRLFGVYAIGLMYELIVIVPAQIVWFQTMPFSAVGAICTVLIPLVLSVLVLSLSAIIGWAVALIAGRLKHKNFVIVLATLVFFVAYYYVYGKAYSILQTILQNSEAVGNRMKSVLYPLYHMGLAAEGSIVSMLIFTAIIAVLFTIVYIVLSRSFIKLATANRGAAKTVYKSQKSKVRSLDSALLQKELRRFIGSYNYMLNCGLGILLMPIAAIMLVWKAEAIREILAVPQINQFIPLFATGAVCIIAAMNDITSPSVSLEGKNLWLLQSFPVSSKQVLAAKLKLHLLLTVIPVVPLIIAVLWLIKPEPLFAVLIPIAILSFIVFMASFGLFINLKMPNLNWTNEIVPIKQSLGVMIALFGGWVIIIAFAIICYLLENLINPLLFLCLACLLLLVSAFIFLRWIFTRGAKILSTL